MSNSSVPRGPGLFEVGRVNGERLITNVRRIAGADRAPGSALVSAAAVLLALLAAGLFVVSLTAQYRYVFAVKHQVRAERHRGVGLDVRYGRVHAAGARPGDGRAVGGIERALIVVCAVASAGQNSPRRISPHRAAWPLTSCLRCSWPWWSTGSWRWSAGTCWATLSRRCGRLSAGGWLRLSGVAWPAVRAAVRPGAAVDPAGLRRLVLVAAPLPEAAARAGPLTGVSPRLSTAGTEPPD